MTKPQIIIDSRKSGPEIADTCQSSSNLGHLRPPDHHGLRIFRRQALEETLLVRCGWDINSCSPGMHTPLSRRVHLNTHDLLGCISRDN